MARLKSANFSVDLCLANYSHEITEYHLRLSYGKTSIFNLSITERDFFVINEVMEDDPLIMVLEEALYKGIETSWMPCETAMFIVIDPIFVDGKESQADSYIIDFYIEAEELKELEEDDKGVFPGNAISVRLIVNRDQLLDFYNELKQEFKNHYEIFKIEKLFNSKTDSFENVSALAKQFHHAILDIHRKAYQKYGHKGDTLIGMIEEHGGVRTAKMLLRGPDKARGLARLQLMQICEGKGMECSVEALVVDPKWEKLFNERDIKVAWDRLRGGNSEK